MHMYMHTYNAYAYAYVSAYVYANMQCIFCRAMFSASAVDMTADARSHDRVRLARSLNTSMDYNKESTEIVFLDPVEAQPENRFYTKEDALQVFRPSKKNILAICKKTSQLVFYMPKKDIIDAKLSSDLSDCLRKLLEKAPNNVNPDAKRRKVTCDKWAFRGMIFIASQHHSSCYKILLKD